MHCKDTILRTQNNWPYSKLIPNSGIFVKGYGAKICRLTTYVKAENRMVTQYVRDRFKFRQSKLYHNFMHYQFVNLSPMESP